MKIVILCLALIFTFAGCTTHIDTLETASAKPAQENVSITTTQSKIKKVEPEKEDMIIVSDISNWKHPTKEVFAKNGLKVIRIELNKEKTYPTFVLEPFSDYYLENADFLNMLAEKNGYWDFKITDGIKFIEVFCDKANKIIYKTVTDTKTTDTNSIDFYDFNGIWYDASFAHIAGYYSKITIASESNSNQADIKLESSTNETGKSLINTNILFNFAKEARFSNLDTVGNKIDAKITLFDKGTIIFDFLESTTVKDSKNVFTIGFGRFIRESDYLDLQKSMEILEKKYGFDDKHKGFYIPKTEDESVYFVYEDKTDDGRYRIEVRRCKDTSACAWYIVNPNTEEVEIEN